jgi:hypothetical protein
MVPGDMAIGSVDGSTVQSLDPASASGRDARPELAFKACEHCGNRYDKAFVILMDGKQHVFDSFECAIHMLAPRCGHCSCAIIGHGVESAGAYFCCAHCAKKSGVDGLVDRTGPHV